MKKVLFVGMVFGALALTSCKKDYKCTVGSGDTKIVTEHNDLDKDERDSRKTQCEVIGGTWSTN